MNRRNHMDAGTHEIVALLDAFERTRQIARDIDRQLLGSAAAYVP